MAAHGDHGAWKNVSALLVKRWRPGRLLRRLRVVTV
jgi:hypothetical protein